MLQLLDDAQRLAVVFKAAVILHGRIERILAGVAERRVAEIVGQRDSFGQILMQSHRAADRAGDLGHLDRVG